MLEYLGPGDISTHAFNGNPESILDGQGKLRPEVRAAVDRGVIMDVAHGGVCCDLQVVKASMEQGLLPDTISTDIHNPPPAGSPVDQTVYLTDRIVYPMNDLVSQFHSLGLPLVDAVAAATSRPAQVLGLQDSLGSLAVGMSGDAAVFDQQEGRFMWHDMAGHSVDGHVRLDTFLTVRAGAIAWREGNFTQIGEC